MDGQAAFSHLTLNCDLEPSNTVLPHCTPAQDGEHLCQFILIPTTILIKMIGTGQAVLSHLTLNCDLGSSRTVIPLCISHEGEY